MLRPLLGATNPPMFALAAQTGCVKGVALNIFLLLSAPFTLLHVSFPNVVCYYLHIILTLGTLCQIWATFIFLATAFVFVISSTIRCIISQHLVIRANITVIILIINILILFNSDHLRVGKLYLLDVLPLSNF